MSDVDAEEVDSELGKHSTRASHGALLSSQIKTVQRARGVADGLALPSVLKACSCEEGPCLSAQLHACACKAGSDAEMAACSVLITMYLKRGGGMRSAVAAFDGISEPNMIIWTALMAGLA